MSSLINITAEIEIIKNLIAQFPQGATRQEIENLLPVEIPAYTLQRRLKTLVEDGTIRLSGAKRTAKYHLAQQYIKNDVARSQPTGSTTEVISLSNDSLEIQGILSEPWEKRKSVGYHREFLDRYRPNIDFYLTPPEQEHLQRLTATPGSVEQPAGTYANRILERLLIDLSWNSSRLEGNTYSLLETERLLAHGEMAASKSGAEAQMIINHKEAIEFMVSASSEIGFNRYTLLNLHAMLANNLLPDPAAPGRLRKHAVGIKKSAYTPTAIPQLIEEMFDMILSKASAITSPHEQAFFVMVHLPYLQPFDDVNKRVSRLAANIPLNQHNLVPISFIGVPEDLYIQGLLGVYELNKSSLLKDIFVWACERSADRYAIVRQTLGEPDPFRMKYRQLLQQLVQEIVSSNMMPTATTAVIREAALRLPKTDQAKFVEMVETEILSLHEGNFARYRVSPSEFADWKRKWAE